VADVFVSYKKEDSDYADRIAAALREAGFTVWWDDGLTPETAWDAALEKEIAEAATVVVLWSPRSVVSEWVRTEAHYGQDRGKLVPVMIEPCTIPLAFMLKQTVNLCAWRGDRADRQWRKLLTWIADLTSTKPGNANIPSSLGAAQPNPFREAVGRLPSGDPIYDGTLINASTPAGTAFRDGDNRPVMRILPRGAFQLGSPPTDPDRTSVEGPQKRIEIPVPFALGVFPVLTGEYLAVMGAAPSPAPTPPPKSWFGTFKPKPSEPVRAAAPGDPWLPMTHVSFEDAERFAQRLSDLVGEAYRLPSEVEWEYACRAGSRTRYAFGDTIDAGKALFAAQTGPGMPAKYPSNAFGLYDMHGNVREWTADLWHESYDTTPTDGSHATAGHGSMRVVRGGGWCDGPAILRSASRTRATINSRTDFIGFRLVRVLT